MAVNYLYNEQSHYMVTRISGALSLADIADHIQRTIDLNRPEYPWLEVVDCRSVNDITGINGTGLRNVAVMEQGGLWAEGSKSAIVVSSMLHYGLARIFITVASRAEKTLNVFYDINEAISWLNLEHEQAPISDQLDAL